MTTMLRGPLAREIKIDELGLQWGPAESAGNGEWIVRKAPATAAFWAAYRQHRDALKSIGIGCSKRGDAWYATWFQRPSTDEMNRRAEEREMSRASDATVEFPAPGKLKRYPYQNAGIAYGLRKKNILLADAPGLGKDQPIISRILTPDGWLTMGDMTVGQRVIGRDGKTYAVTGVYPQGMKPIYRVHFRDGTQAECGHDHLWAVKDGNMRVRGKSWSARPLSEIMKRGLHNGRKDNRSGNKWEIPLVEPVEFPEAPHRIDPYILGVLIGDGYLVGGSAIFSNPDMDDDIREEVRRRLPDGYIVRNNWRKDAAQCPQFTISYAPNGQKTRGKNVIKMEIARLGLNIKSRYRFIPPEYKLGSAEQRLALLRGLMDTDGSSGKNRINYHTLSHQLALDVADLVRSLGGVAIVRFYDRSDEGKPSEYQVNVKMNTCPFICARKAKNWRAPQKGARVCKFIEDVEYVGIGLTQCISVSSPDHLYVTDDYIVTHNTTQAVGVIDFSNANSVLIITPASLKLNWEREIKMWLTRPMTVGVVKPGKHSWPQTQVVIINYDLLKKYDDEIKRQEWDVLVADEAHALKGGSKTLRGRHAFGNRNHGIKPIRAKRRIFLTGTPIMNRPIEIWPLIHYLDPEAWSSFPAFAKRYCNAQQTSFGFQANGATNLDELQDRLRETLMIRRLKEEVLTELPPKTRQLMSFPSTGAEQQIAAEMEAFTNLKDRINELRARFELAKASPIDGDYKAATNSLRQGVNEAFTAMARARKAVAIAKLPTIIDHIESQLENGGKLVVFCHHREVHESLMHHFNKIAVGIVGGDNAEARQAAVDAFQKNDRVRVFVGSLLAAGTGITLTASSHVIMAELDWTPANMIQGEDRCVLEGELILTPSGWAPIETIKAGDLVITHTGAAKRVTAAWSRKPKGASRRHSKNIVEIHARGTHRPLIVTEDHKVLTVDSGWIDARLIRPGDKVAMPRAYDGEHRERIKIPESCRLPTMFVGSGGLQRNGRLITLPEHVDLTQDALFTFGYYIGDGFCRNVNKIGDTKTGRFVSVAGNTGKKVSSLNMIEAWFAGIGVHKRVSGAGQEWRFYCGEWALWFSEQFGRIGPEKSIPEWVFGLSREQRSAFLDGLSSSDGYRRKGRIEIITAYENLAAQIARLMASLGHKPCITVGSTGQWVVAFTAGVKPELCVSKISIRSPTSRDTVYDLTVEDDHTFCVMTGVVHNCHRIGTKSNVLSQWCVLDGSLDSKIAKTLMDKAEIIEQALDRRREGERPPVEPQQAFADKVSVFDDEDIATRQANRDRIAKEAEHITPADIMAIHGALRFLAAMDADGARAKNAAGFARIDSRVGRELAGHDHLTARQAALGLRIARKYAKTQLGGMADEISEIWGRVTGGNS